MEHLLLKCFQDILFKPLKQTSEVPETFHKLAAFRFFVLTAGWLHLKPEQVFYMGKNQQIGAFGQIRTDACIADGLQIRWSQPLSHKGSYSYYLLLLTFLAILF